jgi:Ca2+-binding EF-hand superfamily protein
VSRPAFTKVLAHSRLGISDDQISAIAKRFETADGQVDLGAFLDCIVPEPVAVTPPDVTETMERIRAHLAIQKMTLRPEFEKYDRKGTGELFASVARVAFHRCGISFGAGEFEVLQSVYEVSAGVIDWRRLCADLQSAGARRGVSMEDPAPTPVRSRELMQPRRMPLLTKISEACRSQGAFILADFQGLDKRKQGYVSKIDLLRELTALGNPLSREEIGRLFASYQDPASGSFDYLSFCRDVDHQASSGDTQPLETPDLVQAIRHYKAFLISRHVDAQSIFLRFDRTNTGHLPIETLQTAFGSAGIDFTKAELQALIEAFTDPTFRDRFRYRKLDDRAQKEVVTAGQIRFLLNPAYALEEQTRMRTGALTEIREKLMARRRGIGVVFIGVETDTISVAEFRERLSRAGLIPSKPQIDVLAVYYGKGDGQLDWKAFRDDCEASAIVGSRK